VRVVFTSCLIQIDQVCVLFEFKDRLKLGSKWFFKKSRKTVPTSEDFK